MFQAIQALIDWLASFFATLLCWLDWLAKSMVFAIIAAVNLILKAIAALVNAAISLLPEANGDPPKLANDIIGMLNWMFPVGPLMFEAGLIITAWALYKAYRYLFRWVV